jgi:hypothetical protein
MIKQIAREEGIRGFYKGLSASYLGVTEGTIQWVLYERLKRMTASVEKKGGLQEWAGMLTSAGTAKCVASLITYPHEVRVLFFPVFSHMRTDMSGSDPVGSPNAATTTPCQWPQKIHGLGPNPPSGHRRRGCTIIVWRPQCSSHARCTQRCCYVLHLRRYSAMGC